MKKIFSLILLTTLLIQLPIAALANDSNFSNTGTINNSGIINNGTINIQFNDIQVNSWSYEAITSMSKKGVVNGYEDGSFRPENSIAREEFAKMIAVTFGLNLSVTQDVYYSDVLPDRWSFPYITATKDYLTGYYPPKGKAFFDPAAKATREDVAVALVKIAGLNTQKYSSHFTDEDQISPGLKKYVDVAADYKLINGYPDGTFKPNNPISRAEVAALLYRTIKGTNGDNSQNPSVSTNQPVQVDQTHDKPIPLPNTDVTKPNINAPDLWADVIRESLIPALPNLEVDPISPIAVIVKGETTPGSKLTVNGEDVIVDRLGKFSVRMPIMKEDTYNFEIKSSYFEQVTTISKSIMIVIDPPKLTLEAPAPTVVSTFDTSFRIRFDWIDKNDNNTPTLYVNGQKRTFLFGGRVTNGGSGIFEVALQNGRNDFTIKLVNRFGKKSNTVTKSVYYQPN